MAPLIVDEGPGPHCLKGHVLGSDLLELPRLFAHGLDRPDHVERRLGQVVALTLDDRVRHVRTRSEPRTTP